MKTGITGQSGFIGAHLHRYLGLKADIERIPFEKDFFKNDKALRSFVKTCDSIVHIAAVNRHPDEQILYHTNIDLVNKLIHACTAEKVIPKIIFASSIQEERDNPYGKSKREGRKALENWAKQSGASVCSLLIPNVYGPFGKPFYNSVIATFSYQLTHGEKPQIQVDGELPLLYINEVSDFFYTQIKKQGGGIETIPVPHTATKKVSEILALLTNFKETYMEKGNIPDIQNPFELNLFNTFTSFLPKTYFPRSYTKHTDQRGSFLEIVRADTPGQTSCSTTKPGITRGNHFHTRKVERFAVVSGKALIQLRKIDSDEVISYELDGNQPAYVDMPIWHTHAITNTGDTDLITLFWINEPYNPDDPDTYFVIV